MKAYALPPSYYRGVEARDAGMGKDAPGHLGPICRAWWLAGWNDRDIELTT